MTLMCVACLSVSLTTAYDDWSSFLSRSDMLWQWNVSSPTIPTSLFEGAIFGNAMLGSTLYAVQDEKCVRVGTKKKKNYYHAAVFGINRCGILEQSSGETFWLWLSIFNNMNLIKKKILGHKQSFLKILRRHFFFASKNIVGSRGSRTKTNFLKQHQYTLQLQFIFL